MSFAVLVVADDEIARHFIERVLQQNELHVESVGTAIAAAERLAKSRFDAIILDSDDAFVVLRYLHAADASLIPRTVVATSRPRDAANAELRDVCRVILKPFDARRLLEAIAECLSIA